jgi:hypothetical protein
VVEKAPPVETSTLTPYLRKEEDPVAASTANLVFIPPVDVTSVGVDLIILSSGLDTLLLALSLMLA